MGYAQSPGLTMKADRTGPLWRSEWGLRGGVGVVRPWLDSYKLLNQTDP